MLLVPSESGVCEMASEKYLPVLLSDVDKLLSVGDGNAALLWLHLLRTGSFSLNRASRALKCTEDELRVAAALLRKEGLLRDAPETQEAPEYTPEDMARRFREDLAYQATVRAVENTLGRTLSGNDLRLLLSVYDYWGLPPEVIMMLLTRCAELARERYGPGRRPTMRAVEQEARRWAGLEVRSVDDAERLIRQDKEHASLLGRVQKLLGIHDRRLSPSERDYVERWLDWGFSPDALAIAYDRTVVSTGRLTWKYMDKMLESWSRAGLLTPEQIEAKDPRGQSRRGPAQPEQRSDLDKMELSRALAQRMKENKDGA